ncbi:hypothetical protein C2E23DRAFT_744811 [Lenzites betulinus]|nr:hypothetical protein C2E23DRAFT_744811 [Lenzites betulinus]
MPIDGHTHLVKQGWSGKGTGLRNGAIAKPITITQKKTLAGIGKDRDEAFPFWDHVFQAAAVSIQLKLHNSDDESSGESGDQTPALELKRTATGILSNRRPVSGTPALSGAATPAESLTSSGSSGSGSLTPQLSLMAVAKQQAARRMLYASFYRGPLLTGDDEDGAESPASQAGPSNSVSASSPSPSTDTPVVRRSEGGKKRKMGEDQEKHERKRRKREAKAEAEGRERKKLKGKERDSSDTDVETVDDKEAKAARKLAKAARKLERAERRQRKAEKRARKEEKEKKKAQRKVTSISQQPEDTTSGDEAHSEDDAIPIQAKVVASTRAEEGREKVRKAKKKAKS